MNVTAVESSNSERWFARMAPFMTATNTVAAGTPNRLSGCQGIWSCTTKPERGPCSEQAESRDCSRPFCRRART